MRAGTRSSGRSSWRALARTWLAHSPARSTARCTTAVLPGKSPRISGPSYTSRSQAVLEGSPRLPACVIRVAAVRRVPLISACRAAVQRYQQGTDSTRSKVIVLYAPWPDNLPSMIRGGNEPGTLVNNSMTFLDVNVRDPIMHDVNGDHYTTYDISIETNNSSFTMPRSAVRRRFSEFVHLRSLLKELQPSLTPPRLPSRTIMKRFDDKFIEERRSGLETFLRDVLTEPLYLSNKGLHLFIQTSLTMKEIEDVVKGTEGMPESKPPIVLSLHDEVFDEIGDSAYESAAEDSTAIHATATGGSATTAPGGITRKTSSVTMLHSSKCCRGDGHCHLRIGSSICVCTPTLMPPSWEGSHDRSSGLLQSLSCPLPATSTPIAAMKTTAAESRSTCSSPDLAANNAARLRTSASDSCLETLGGMKKHVSFSSAVEILDRVSECHGCNHLNLSTPPSAFDDDRSSTASSTSSPGHNSDSS